MTLNLIKLCVGATSIEDLAEWQLGRLAEARKAGRKPELWHRTRMFPKRRAEVLDGGSLFWVIKGAIQVRQSVLDLRPFEGEDGITRCDIVLASQLVAVRPAIRRPFQGWRYLPVADSPVDLRAGDAKIAGMPQRMRAELLALGLL